MPLNFQRPTFQRRFAFPEQFFVTMHMAAVDAVFGRVIAKQTQVKKIGGARQKFEGREVSLDERSGIGPNPEDKILFHYMYKIRLMQDGVKKLKVKPEVPHKLH